MRIIFTRKDKRPTIQAMNINDAFLAGMFGEKDKYLPADSILVLDENGKHIGFLDDVSKKILLAIEPKEARCLHGKQLNLKKIRTTLKGWEIYKLPANPAEWLKEEGNGETLKEMIKDIVEARFSKNEKIRGALGESTFGKQIESLCSLRPWKRPTAIAAVVWGVQKKVAEGHEDAEAAFDFLSQLASAMGVSVNDLMHNPTGIGLLGKGALNLDVFIPDFRSEHPIPEHLRD